MNKSQLGLLNDGRFKFIFVLLLVLLVFVNELETKVVYNELLTDDNELLLIEPAPKTNTKKGPTSNGTHSSGSKNSSQKGVSVGAGGLNHSQSASPSSTSSNLDSSNKLIVKIVYSSNNNSNFKNESSPSKLSSSKSNVYNLVYSTFYVNNPCERNPCKVNETCLLTNKQTNSSSSFKCVPKSKLTNPVRNKRDVKQPPDHAKFTKTISLTNQCTMFDLITLKLNLFERFDQTINKQAQIERLRRGKINAEKHNLVYMSCLDAVTFMFEKLDQNNNSLVDYYEWFAHKSIKRDQCSEILFSQCDEDDDQYLSYNELCSCFQGARPKCFYIRDKANADYKYEFINSLNKLLFKNDSAVKNNTAFNHNLSSSSYAPICDSDGYFKAEQCDSRVTCWCASKSGEPDVNSVKQLSDSLFNCEQV